MISNQTTIIIVIVLIIIIAYYYYKREGFTSASLDIPGGTFGEFSRANKNITGYDRMYEYGSQYNPFYPVAVEPKRELFSIPTGGGSVKDKSWIEQQTVQRLDRIDDKLLPRVSNSVTPYNVDVADPIAYTFQVHAPRVIRKDRLAMQADPIRGDIPITYYPDIPIIQQSQYNRDSLRLDGTFSDAFKAQYDRLSGSNAYFNLPTFNSYGASITT